MCRLGLRDNLREALRRIRRNPGMSLAAACTLALGIGAATAIFTIAHTYLMAPPPFRESDRIVNGQGWSGARGRQGVSGADFAVAGGGGALLGAWLITGLRALTPVTLAIGWALYSDYRICNL